VLDRCLGFRRNLRRDGRVVERIEPRFVLSHTSLSHTYVGISFSLMVLTNSSIWTGFVK
jgi:hypothetical protein